MTRFGAMLVGGAALTAVAATALVFAWRSDAARPAAVGMIEEGRPPPPLAGGGEASAAPVAPTPEGTVAPAPPATAADDTAARLVQRLLDEPEGADAAAALLALGPAAAAALIARLDRGAAGATRERLVDALRKLPGPAVEERLALEARGGPHGTTRTMAMDALAERKSDRALQTLATIARTDPELPARPLIAEVRDPNAGETELPDEQTFTPRMQAMAALASTKDARAIPTLIEVVRNGPDESLRMEAARHLGAFQSDPRVAEALRAAAATDPSAYVRLSALHSLRGSSDPALPALLARIGAEDRDAGVRALARQVLASLSAP
jgi:hypothetical protein